MDIIPYYNRKILLYVKFVFPNFSTNSRDHFRELLISFINLKKFAAEADEMLVNAYGEALLREGCFKMVNLNSTTNNIVESVRRRRIESTLGGILVSNARMP